MSEETTEFLDNECLRLEAKIESVLGPDWRSKIMKYTDFGIMREWKKGDKWPENMGEVK